MVVGRPDDRWREAANRLVADTSLLDLGLERDLLGELGPSKSMGAFVLEAGRLVVTRMEKLAARLDSLYGDQLDTNTQERLHAAMQHLHTTAEVLTGLPEKLHPDHRGWSV